MTILSVRFMSVFSSHMNCTDTHRRLDQRKFFSSSTAWGFRDDKCDHTHPGFDNTFAALDTTAAQDTLTKHTHKPPDAKDHPGCALSTEPPSPGGHTVKCQHSKTSKTTKTDSRLLYKNITYFYLYNICLSMFSSLGLLWKDEGASPALPKP